MNIESDLLSIKRKDYDIIKVIKLLQQKTLLRDSIFEDKSFHINVLNSFY